jgi:hypothetical protein
VLASPRSLSLDAKAMFSPQKVRPIVGLVLAFLVMAGGCPMEMPTPGPAGANGSLRIYGNGSAGAVTVAGPIASTASIAPTGNLQFTDLTIPSGVALFVPSGTIIRCTGTFTNNGTITVFGVVSSAGQGHFGDGTEGSLNLPAAGVSGNAASSGEIGDETADRAGGRGGTGLAATEARNLLAPGVIGGGGGAGANSGVAGIGGGVFIVLAQRAIINAAAATITANGGTGAVGSGGGGGGVIILASAGEVSNLGAVSAIGGNGAASDASRAPGGGGGGGIVHFLAPSMSGGAVTVTGGAAGALGGAGSILTITRVGGGGGGGCAGSGGSGGRVLVGLPGTPTESFPGFAGTSLQTIADPTSLF